MGASFGPGSTRFAPEAPAGLRPAGDDPLRMAVHYSSARIAWETPPGFFEECDRRFGFDLDVCASDENAKCPRYFTEADDGLQQEWTGTCWMNPPYGREISHWMRKAYESSLAGATVVCLVPARTDTRWWHDYAIHGSIEFIRGRLTFVGAKKQAPFPNAIVVFRPLPCDSDRLPQGEDSRGEAECAASQSGPKGIAQ